MQAAELFADELDASGPEVVQTIGASSWKPGYLGSAAKQRLQPAVSFKTLPEAPEKPGKE